MVWFAGWLWQGVALTLLTALILHTSRAVNAATRYALWWLTLAAVFAHPVVSSLAPYLSSLTASSIDGPPLPERALFAFTVPHVPDWVLATGAGLWIAAVLWNVIRLAVGLRGLRDSRRSAVPIDPAIEARLPLWLSASRTGRAAQLCVSDTAVMPCALGLGRPLVIVPRRLLTALAPHDLDQIVVHEHAHLQRYDDWGRFLQVVIEQLVPFHPAVRWIAARLDLEREIASDDWVIARTGAPAAYARCLTRLAEQMTPAAVPTLTPAALRRRAQVVSRVERLLDPSRNARPRISSWAAIGLALVMVALSGRAEQLLGIREAGSFEPIMEAHAAETLASHRFAHADDLQLSRPPTLSVDTASARSGRRTTAISATTRRGVALTPAPAWRRSSHRADAPDRPRMDDIDSALHDLDDRRALQFRPISLALDRIAAGSGPPDEDGDPQPSVPAAAEADSVPTGGDEVHHPDLPLTLREGVTAPPAPTGASKKPQFFTRVGRSVARLFGIHVRSPGLQTAKHAGKKSRSEAPRRADRFGRQTPPAV